MSNWFHRFFNPHCEHCHDELEDSRVCQSCETLKQQLAEANHEKKLLFDRLLNPSVPTIATEPERVITRPTTIPWNVRKHMLEAEDRKQAQLLRDAPVPKVSTEDLEKELDIVARERGEANAIK